MNLTRPMNISIRIITIVIGLSIFLPVFSEQLSENQIKVNYITNFIKDFSWEKENTIDTFRIGAYGNDISFITSLKSIEKLKIRNKPIKVSVIKLLNNPELIQILVVTTDKNNEIATISTLFKGRNTLLVTDRCNLQSYEMINFVYYENTKIQFELNSRNIEEAKIVISPLLILLGGSEVDIRKLYLETEKSCNAEKDKALTFEKELKQRKDEIQIQNTKIAQQNKAIELLQSKITSQKKDLGKLNQQNNDQKKELDIKTIELLRQKKELVKQDKHITARDIDLIKKQKKLDKYNTLLNAQKKEIDNRQKIIAKKVSW